MYLVVLTVKVPSSKRSDVINIFESFSGPISVQPGCKGIRLYSDVNNDDDLILVEEWNSPADLKRHVLSDDFLKILAVMDMADEPPEIHFHEVSSTKGFELVKKLRNHGSEKGEESP